MPYNSKPTLTEGSTSDDAVPSGPLVMPYQSAKINTTKKKPSIEKYLGSSHGNFVYDADSTASNGPSAHGSGNENGLPSASDTTQTSTASLAVIKRVPMPRFPIRVFNGKPPPFSVELQRRKMRWRYDWLHNLEPHCIQDPDIHRIQETARYYLKSIAPEADTVSVSLLARGQFNQAYNVITENLATGFRKEFIFRVSLPVWPYYKVESDVATTEFARHSTGIPVPIIYAFDSNPSNRLGFEWMLVEKIQGTPLNAVWDTMGFDTKQAVIGKLASWMAELSQFKFRKIGSIFMRYQQNQMEFYIGPTMHERLFVGDRLLYEVDRGPFQSVQALYASILDTAGRYFNDLRHRAGHAQEVPMSKDSDVHETLSSPGVARDTQQRRPNSEEAILAQADAEDQGNEGANGFLKHTLSRLPEKVRRYRILLPKLCAFLPASEPLTTMLTHPDLIPPNIFVDNNSVPVALIDWERARLEPIALVDIIPRFLDEDGESDAFYAAPGIAVKKEPRAANVYNCDSLARIRGVSEWSYEQVMGRIQRTRLRAVYREGMKRLKSPMCEAFNRDPESLEQELMRRVYWPENPGNTAPNFWAAKYLGESILDDSDDEQENA